MTEVPSPNGANGRDTSGRFTKGNPGGPGNPFARRVASLRAAMIEAVGDDGVRQIVASLVAAARGGDVAAAKIVLSYAIGKPTPAPDPDLLDIHERELIERRTELDDKELLYNALCSAIRCSGD